MTIVGKCTHTILKHPHCRPQMKKAVAKTLKNDDNNVNSDNNNNNNDNNDNNAYDDSNNDDDNSNDDKNDDNDINKNNNADNDKDDNDCIGNINPIGPDRTSSYFLLTSAKTLQGTVSYLCHTEKENYGMHLN